MLANRSKNKNSNDENLETKSPFEQFCFDVVEKRIISGEEIFTLKKLFESLKQYDDDIAMTTSRLKEKLSLKYPTLIFHQSKCKNKSDLVYNDCLTAGNVLGESIHPNESSTVDESSQDELSQDEPPSYSHYIENREMYHCAMFLRGISSKIEINLPWPPDSNDLKYENAAEIIPKKLKHFLSLLLGFTDDPLSSELRISESDEKKVVSISQDLIQVATCGRTLTHK